MNFKITCRCGHFVTKNDDLYRLSYYKVIYPTLKRTEKGERIIEETFYAYVCPECNSDVVVIKRKARNAAGNIKLLLPVKLTGLFAVEYLQQTENNRLDKTHTLKYDGFEYYGKGIPLSYFKAVDSTHQRRRYINEAEYSGCRLECQLRFING